MARGNNQKQSSARSELSDDDNSKRGVASFLIDALNTQNAQAKNITIGDVSFKTIAPRDRAEEMALANNLLTLKGLTLLPSGLRNANATNLALLAYPKDTLVNTPMGKATTQNLKQTLEAFRGNYKQADFSSKASGLADLLNDMVAKEQGGSALFKETDKLYQNLKTARDSGKVGKTTELNAGRVSDVSGDNFQLSDKVGGGNEKLFFRPMQKAELTAGEMYTVVNEVQSLVRRISDRSTTVPIGGTTDKYLPARYNGVSDIDSPSWFKISLKRNDTGFEPVKVKFITSDKEREKAKTNYRDGNNY